MKAAVVLKAGEIAVLDLPEPSMGDYEARCEILCGSVCAGTDTHLVEGHPPFCYWLSAPFILGHESVGRVVETGAKVRHLKVGDVITRVGCPPTGEVTTGWGGFAETGIATDWRAMKEDGLDGWQDKTVQQVLPDDVSPEVGTLFITWRETLSYLTRMGVRKDSSILILGSGGNGLAFASHAINLGASRVAMLGAANRASDAKRAGVTHYVDYRAEKPWEQVMEASPEGFDFVVDALGKADLVASGQGCLKEGGTIGIYGLDEAGKIHLTPGKTFTFYGGGYDEAEAHEAVLAHFRAGRLKPEVWTDASRAFSLDNIAEAFTALANRELIKPLVNIAKA